MEFSSKTNLNQNNLVVQANKLIRGKKVDNISIREQKLLYTVISLIEPNDEEFKEYNINVNELYDLWGVSRKTPSIHIKNVCNKIMERKFNLNDDENDESFHFINIISESIYNKNDGYITIKINQNAKPLLLQLKKNFTSFKLFNILKLKSEYSVLLYQFLKSYSYKREYNIKVSTLKKILIDDENTFYDEYTYFKRNIVKKAIKEINEKTDLLIDFKENKLGRKTDSLTFIITEKEIMVNKIPNNNIINEMKIINDVLNEKFIKYNLKINSKDFKFIYDSSKKIWENDLLKNLSFVVDDILNNNEIKKPIAFLKYKLKLYIENIENGFEWDFGEKGLKSKELLPDWFLKRNDNIEEKNSIDVDFEQERLKMLEKLKKL